MLSKKGFDEWMKSYDKDVVQTDEAGRFPFAGYRDVLYTIYQMGLKRAPKTLLDVGVGTGVLAKQFYAAGVKVEGMDFSAEMLKKAQKRLPDATLLHGDMREGLPDGFSGKSYDLITGTYALHHLNHKEKVRLLEDLRKRLNDDGVLLIGDVAFETHSDHDTIRRNHQEDWDEDEHYWVYETIQKDFPKSLFLPISYCAGVLIVRK